MKPNEIRAALRLKNKKQVDIARSFNPPVSDAAVTRVINGDSKSERIRRKVADSINKKYNEVWLEAAA